MLPPSPPTDPDVQISRIRFLASEFRPERYTYRPFRLPGEVTMVPIEQHRHLIGVAIHRRFVDRDGEVQALVSVSRRWSHWRRLPSLGRVLLSAVPRRHRYYEGATTSRPISPTAYQFAAGYHANLHLRVLAEALPHSRRGRAGQDLGSAGGPCPAFRRVDGDGISQVPWRSFLCLCPAPGPRSDQRRLTITVAPMLPPCRGKRRLRRSEQFRGLPPSFSTRCLRFKGSVARPRQDSLSAGRLTFAARESNPLDRYERFQVTHMAFLLSRAYPGATSNSSG